MTNQTKSLSPVVAMSREKTSILGVIEGSHRTVLDPLGQRDRLSSPDGSRVLMSS